MWREKASYDDIFARVKAIRGVANPNIGFTCQLLQWQKRRNAPPARTRMYRIASHSQHAPLLLVPRTVTPPKKYATHTWRELDPRGAFIIQTPTRLYVWQGSQCPDSHGAAARAAARLLPKYETPGCSEISVFHQGRESEEFIALMDPPALDPDAERQNARRASITGELVGALSFGPLSNGASAAATPNETTGPPLLPHSTSLGPHGGSRLGSMSRAMPDSGVATQPCADAAAAAGCDVHMAVSQPFTEGAEKATAADVQGCGPAAAQLPPGVKARQRSQGCSTDWSHEDGGEQAAAMDQDQPGRQEHLVAGCQARQQQPMELEGDGLQPALPGPHAHWYAQEVDDYSPDFQLWAGAMRVASASTNSGLLLGVFGSDSFLDVLPVLPLASRSLLAASPTPDRTISALYPDLPSTAPPVASATLLRTSGSSGAAALAADWGTGRTDGRLSLAGDTRHEGGVHGAMAKEAHGCLPHAPCPHSLSSPMQPALETLLLDQPALPLSAQHQGPSFGSPLRASQWPAVGTCPGSPFLAPFQGQPLPDSPATLEGRSRKMSKRGMVLDKPMKSHSRLAESLSSQDLM